MYRQLKSIKIGLVHDLFFNKSVQINVSIYPLNCPANLLIFFLWEFFFFLLKKVILNYLDRYIWKKNIASQNFFESSSSQALFSSAWLLAGLNLFKQAEQHKAWLKPSHRKLGFILFMTLVRNLKKMSISDTQNVMTCNTDKNMFDAYIKKHLFLTILFHVLDRNFFFIMNPNHWTLITHFFKVPC